MSNGRNFDAGQLLDQLLGTKSGGAARGGALGDLLGGILGGAPRQGGGSGQNVPSSGISLEDLLGGILGGAGAGRARPDDGPVSGGPTGGGLPGGISLEDLLGGILGGGAGAGRTTQGSGDDSLGDFAADALAGRRGRTPARLGEFDGSPQEGLAAAAASNPDVLNAIRDYLARNGGALAGGAAAGSLATLVLGSKTGRMLGKNAVALGGLALVGTLAYKAYQNYRQGQLPQQAATPPTQEQLPPAHSPFHPAQADHTHFPITLLRTMIAASLADGHIDDEERQVISAKLTEQGAQLDDAERFLAEEIASPASVEVIAGEVSTPEEAAEVYISALLTVDAESSAERAFLARLALALKLQPDLVPHLEAAASAARQG